MMSSRDIKGFLKSKIEIQNASVLNELLSKGRYIRAKRGDLLIRPEEMNCYIGILISGIVRAYIIDRDGNDISFRFAFEPGRILVNENYNINDSSFYWEAINNVEVLLLPLEIVNSVIKRDEPFRVYFEESLQKLYECECDLHYALLTMQSKERYLWFLDRYSNFPDNIPQKYIATYLNMLPQTLSQVRKELNMAREKRKSIQ